MKRFLCAFVCILVVLSFCSCSSCSNDEGGTLATPVITMSSENVASWDAIKGANAYEYKINDGEVVRVDSSVTALKLLPSEKIVVRAIGDGEKYFDSEWSQEISAQGLAQLPKPKLELQAFGEQIIVTWSKDSRAQGYEYRLNSDKETMFEGDELAFLISNEDTFYVRAKGDGTTYLDSDWAEVKPEK